MPDDSERRTADDGRTSGVARAELLLRTAPDHVCDRPAGRRRSERIFVRYTSVVVVDGIVCGTRASFICRARPTPFVRPARAVPCACPCVIGPSGDDTARAD